MAQHQQSFAANQAKALNDAVCYQTDIQYWSAVARQEIVTVAEDFRNSIAALVKTIKERVEAVSSTLLMLPPTPLVSFSFFPLSFLLFLLSFKSGWKRTKPKLSPKDLKIPFYYPTRSVL